MTKHPPFDTFRFDDIITAGPERIWGLEAIAAVLGVSTSTARRMAKEADMPIYRPDGCRYFAFRSDLIQWLRTK
mgnify:CR=1 FL=1